MSIDLEADLYKSGLEKKEAKVYAYLLSKGGGFPSTIAEKTGVNRSTTYKILLRLSIIGLIGETKKRNKLYYFSESPQKLKNYKKTEIKIAERQFDFVESILPALKGVYSENRKPTHTFYFEEDSLKQIWDDHLNYKNSTIYAFANTNAVDDFWTDHTYWNHYVNMKIKNKIKTKAFVPDIDVTDDVLAFVYDNVPDWVCPEIKKLPLEFFAFKGEFMIYGDERVSLINLENGHASGVIIVGKSFNRMMRNIFEMLWLATK